MAQGKGDSGGCGEGFGLIFLSKPQASYPLCQNILTAMNFATHTSAMVFYRKEHGLSQTEVARAMATTQSAVARLEKRLLTGADVTLSALQRYAGAIGLSIELTLKPVKKRYGIFPSAEAAIAAAVHTSATDSNVSHHWPQRRDHRATTDIPSDVTLLVWNNNKLPFLSVKTQTLMFCLVFCYIIMYEIPQFIGLNRIFWV